MCGEDWVTVRWTCVWYWPYEFDVGADWVSDVETAVPALVRGLVCDWSTAPSTVCVGSCCGESRGSCCSDAYSSIDLVAAGRGALWVYAYAS